MWFYRTKVQKIFQGIMIGCALGSASGVLALILGSLFWAIQQNGWIK